MIENTLLKLHQLFILDLFLFSFLLLVLFFILILGTVLLVGNADEGLFKLMLFMILLFIIPFTFRYFKVGVVLLGLVLAVFSVVLFCIIFGKKTSEEIEEAGLKDATGKVVKEIKGRERKGKVKISNELWWAKGTTDALISPGEEVTVKDMEGITLIVEKVEEGKEK